jgi:hypothetical protein
MKILFVTAKENTDHLASVLWDGLQEVVGEDNVYDAVGMRLLHASSCGESLYRGDGENRFGFVDILTSIGARREGRVYQGESGFDLLVLNAAFHREYNWPWARQWLRFLRPGGKVAYVEGWDSAYEVHTPEIHHDVVFRKEISTHMVYPYKCHHLTFAAPSRWFHVDDESNDRPRDIFYSGTTHSNDVRWPMLAGVFASKHAHKSVIASSHLGVSVAQYFNYYRQSKLALCPASAEGADSLRTYEAVACGAIPLFVGYPPWKRDDWFSGKVFECNTAAEVAGHIDAALDRDLPAMRRELLAHARKYHTTRARAEKLLRLVGAS